MRSSTRRLVDDRSRIHRASRSEIKFVLDAVAGRAVADLLIATIPMAESPSGAHSWVVRSTYYDDMARTLMRAAHADPTCCTKVRTREYVEDDGKSDVHDRVWLEVKSRHGVVTDKVRYPIPRGELPAVLAADGGAATAQLSQVSQEAVEALYRLSGGRPLEPVAMVSYRRRAGFLGEPEAEAAQTGPSGDAAAAARRAAEAGGGGARVTLDCDLSYRLPALTQGYAHRDPTVVEDAFYLEVKGAEVPAWLQEALGARSPVSFSKFILITTDWMEYLGLLNKIEHVRRGRAS